MWDQSATNVLIMVGFMVVFAIGVLVVKRRMPDALPLELSFSNEEWGDALRAGERIERQVPVLQPAPWFMQLGANPALAQANGKQLALTSSGALLVADRTTRGLRHPERHEITTVSLENVKSEGEHHVKARLVIANRKTSLFRVPRSFVEALRSRGVRVAAVP